MAVKLFVKHVVQKIFLEDWGLKLTALVITFALWFGVTGLSTPTTRRLNIPLTLNISSNAQVTNNPLEEVEVEISGDKRRIEQLNLSELIASIDLTDVAPGNRVVPLTPETVYVPLPQGIKLVEVQPSRIAVNLEAVDEKEVEVRLITTGAPPAGFEVYSTNIQPPRVRVRGPASVVKIIEYVQTDKIDLAGRREGFTAKQIAVNSPDPKATVLNTFVDVDFRIGEKRVTRAFTIPVTGLDGKSASFVIYAPRTLLAQTKPEAFKVEMILNDKGEEVPQVSLPPEFKDLAEVRKLKLNP